MRYNIGAIVQARMNSNRLPGKVLMPILGIPMLGILIGRIKKVLSINKIIIATTINSIDDDIVNYLKKKINVIIYRGDELNVLERFYKAAKINNLSHILRVTADNPFFDWGLANELMIKIKDQNYDFVANNIKPSFPYGIDLEIMTITALSKAYKNATLQYDIEHVTPYIRNHPKKFSIGNIQNYKDLSKMRLTVDTNEDFIKASSIFDKHGQDVTFRDLI
ncbi:glycosyltransferase family protein [Candidatus Woesearchaeota archaeon]|jgi:spore coat polysaccharide biosynthesis protein SpsF (cytidylyltransferase family)|nr:glycosyltransferase family protein [Candidatus Woesearchaeota archaeon]